MIPSISTVSRRLISELSDPVERQQGLIEDRWLRGKDRSEQRLVARQRADGLPVDALVIVANARIEDNRLRSQEGQTDRDGQPGREPPPHPSMLGGYLAGLLQLERRQAQPTA